MAKSFLTAAWRKLVMVNYAVAKELLLPHLPAGTELDLYEGKCYVSLIGFLFADVRLKGWAMPWHTEFEEVNLRFYVKHTDAAGVSRRGVVFLQELVPRFAVKLIANTVYGESYKTAPMRHLWELGAAEQEILYGWRVGGRWMRLGAQASTEAQPIAEGSVEEFITEHYWGYTRRLDKRGGAKTWGYQVEHPRWEMYPVRAWAIDVDFAEMYGSEFSGLQELKPENVLLAEGSAVVVRSGRRVEVLGGR